MKDFFFEKGIPLAVIVGVCVLAALCAASTLVLITASREHPTSANPKTTEAAEGACKAVEVIAPFVRMVEAAPTPDGIPTGRGDSSDGGGQYVVK